MEEYARGIISARLAHVQKKKEKEEGEEGEEKVRIGGREGSTQESGWPPEIFAHFLKNLSRLFCLRNCLIDIFLQIFSSRGKNDFTGEFCTRPLLPSTSDDGRSVGSPAEAAAAVL